VASYAEGRARLHRGSALAVLVIPPSFRRDIERGRPRVQLLLDGSDPLSAARVGGYVGQVAAAFAVQPAADTHQPDAHMRDVGLIDVRQRFWFNPTLRDRDFFLSAQAVFTTVFFILPSFVLSGTLLPYQLMPHGVREIGALFPLRWYQIALRRIVTRGAGLSEIAGPALALITLFSVILAAIRWRMRPRLG
jgi:hypothetical protein